MSFHRTKATFIGLLEAKRVNEWVVTEKLGDALKNKSNNKSASIFKKSIFKFLGDRYLYMCLSIILLSSLCCCFLDYATSDVSNLLVQTISFCLFSEFWYMSWDSRCFFSSVDAMTSCMGRTTILYIYSFK